MMENANPSLEFWFGNNRNDAAVANAQASLWWSKNLKTDREVRGRFEGIVLEAASGKLDCWRWAIRETPAD